MHDDSVFRLSLIQMRVIGGDRSANLRHAAELVALAARDGAEVILLPETLDLGWTHPSAETDAGPVPGGATCSLLRALAREHSVHLCAGLTERDGDRIYNAAVLVGPDGEILLHHRKLNELAIAHDRYAQGDRVGVAHTPLGTIGIMICADAFARGQVVSRTLGLMGADIILSPCAWVVPGDHDNARDPYGGLWLDHYAPVARDFQVWIAGCSNVGPIEAGPWRGRHCIGSSLVVDPDGRTALRGPHGVEAEAVLALTVEPRTRPARGDAWETLWRRIRP